MRFSMDFNEQPSAFIEMQLSLITTFNIRFSHHIMKLDENLHSIFIMIEEPPEELENSAIQREKRIRTEFSRRFTRDYLYPIHLKMNELENEYLLFIRSKNCKIAQSMVLRPLVLILLKKLSSSTQAYLQFVKKTHTKMFVKLKEVLNMILHFLEIVRSIVDHRILKNNDIEKLCSMILSHMSNEKQKLKRCNVTDREEKIQKPRNSKINVNKPILKKTSGSKSMKNKVHFTSKNQVKKIEVSEKIHSHDVHTCSCSENISEVQRNESFHVPKSNFNCIENDGNYPVLQSSVSDLCSKISEHIVNELLVEVTKEMNDCFQSLAFNAFNLEFTS